MNKTILALAVSAATVATGVNAADGQQAGSKEGTTVYSSNGNSLQIGGRAEARMSVQGGEIQDKSRALLELLGKIDINDGLYGIGFYELEFQSNDLDGTTDKDASEKNGFETKKVYAGIGGGFGEVTYGKNDGALGIISDFTDIMAYHGAAASYKLNPGDTADNMVAYKGDFDNLLLKASYRFADRTEGTADFDNNGQDGYSLSGTYAFANPGFKLGLGLAGQDQDNQYTLAASYKLDNIYLAALYGDGEEGGLDKTAMEFAAAYLMDKFVVTTTYGLQEVEDDTTADALAVDVTHYFKPNFRTYVSYNFNLLDEDDVGKVDSEDELAIGLRYDF